MKTDNQIAPHIRKTIEEMDSDIAALQTDVAELTAARATLVKLYSGETEIPAAPVKLAKPAKVKKAPRAKKALEAGDKAIHALAADKPARGGRAPSADTIKVMAAMRTAAEPFTVESLRVASGIEDKVAISNVITRCKLKDWVKTEARGEYKRTATFPNETPNE